MFKELDAVLLDLARDQEIWYHPNPGNAGDSLIALATWQRFEDLGIRAKEIPDRGFDSTGRVVLYGGGGNLNPRYREAHDFIRMHHRNAYRMVLLPHTVEGCEDLLSELGPNAILFCREAISHAHCSLHAGQARVHISHDLAFGIDPNRVALPDWKTIARVIALAVGGKIGGSDMDCPGIRNVFRVLRFSASHGLRGPCDPSESRLPLLQAFRRDVESIGEPLPKGNLDLSEVLMLRSSRHLMHRTSASLLLGALRSYASVRTDRLHVCIAAALLGLDVEFHPSAGFKCQAIWEHTIRDRYPNVRWAG